MDVVTAVLFVVRNVKTKHNRVEVVQVLHVVLNVPQSVRGIQKVVAVQVLHVVLNAPQSVRGIQKVVVVQVLHVVLNAPQTVKNRHHRVVQIVIIVVVQVVLPNVRTLVIWDATQDAQAIVQTNAKQDVKQDATTPVVALVHT